MIFLYMKIINKKELSSKNILVEKFSLSKSKTLKVSLSVKGNTNFNFRATSINATPAQDAMDQNLLQTPFRW